MGDHVGSPGAVPNLLHFCATELFDTTYWDGSGGCYEDALSSGFVSDSHVRVHRQPLSPVRRIDTAVSAVEAVGRSPAVAGA